MIPWALRPCLSMKIVSGAVKWSLRISKMYEIKSPGERTLAIVMELVVWSVDM
jgi:hypothetical protein